MLADTKNLRLIKYFIVRGRVKVALLRDESRGGYFCSYWIGWRPYKTRVYPVEHLAVDEAIADIFKKWWG